MLNKKHIQCLFSVSTLKNQISPNSRKYRTQPESCYAILFFMVMNLLKSFANAPPFKCYFIKYKLCTGVHICVQGRY